MNVAEQAREDLRWRIVSGEFKQNDTVSVRFVANLLGIGMTPARDALMTLHQEGLVEMRSTGTVVREWTPKEIRAHYQIRLAFEKVALAWVADHMSSALHRNLVRLCDMQEAFIREGDHRSRFRADREFHSALFTATHNKEIVRTSAFLRSLGPMAPNEEFFNSMEEGLAIVAEHREILSALEGGDVVAATVVLQKHLEHPVADGATFP